MSSAHEGWQENTGFDPGISHYLVLKGDETFQDLSNTKSNFQTNYLNYCDDLINISRYNLVLCPENDFTEQPPLMRQYETNTYREKPINVPVLSCSATASSCFIEAELCECFDGLRHFAKESNNISNCFFGLHHISRENKIDHSF